MSTIASQGTPCEDTCTRISVNTRQSNQALSGMTCPSSSSKISQPCTSVVLSSSLMQSRNHGSVEDGDVRRSSTQRETLTLFDLPMEILDKIFSYVGYKKVGQLRVVSTQMNQICSAILNSTFSKLQTQMLTRFQTVKGKMPRRESARRNHPLACECDIIETCYMRLSLLQMTFGKHIERKHCCFFPGGILDEVYNVLNYIRTTPKLERPFKVTDELFDLSTMAMEYFKEHIEPNLPKIVYFSKDFMNFTSKSKQTYSLKTTSDLSDDSSQMSSPPQSNMVLRKGIRKIKQGMKMYNNQLTVLRNELRNCKRKSSEQGKQIAEQQKLLADQQKQTLEYANRLDENDKKNEEMSRKFSTLLQELNKCKTELQYWRSKSPAIQVCTSCGQKIAPVTPEDFQALINQGVNPEDLGGDEIDESDIAMDANLDDKEKQDDAVTFSKPMPRALKRRHDDNSSSGRPQGITSTITSNSLNATPSDGGGDIFNLAMGNFNSDLNVLGPLTNLNVNQCSLEASIGSSDDGVARCDTNDNNVGPVTSISSNPSTSSCIVTDLTSLHSDIKKARRVQNKGSRCHNVSSKRSK